jgi:NAD+ synthase (glutamine-hydrolysing)
MKLWLAQMNPLVGDIEANLSAIRAQRPLAIEAGASAVITPELAICGYPPEDLLFHQGFQARIQNALREWQATPDPQLSFALGLPEYTEAGLFNACLWSKAGSAAAAHSTSAVHRKQALPNYQVFDEKRYFKAGQQATVVEHEGIRLGLLICEDLWVCEPAAMAVAAGAEVLVVLNASPYDRQKPAERERIARARIAEVHRPIVYLNMVGGQDELVFDGGSFVMNARGEITTRLKSFAVDGAAVEWVRTATGVEPKPGRVEPPLSPEAMVYHALVMGVRDYVRKHGFPGVVLGLSGGIDSALTLAIAADALGAQAVHAVMMPSRYTAQMSRDDAKAQADAMGVRYSEISIEPMFKATQDSLKAEFAGKPVDVTEENIQSRCRGVLLMALSNKTGAMVLTTGNKSEMAVGYATLYGDMAGGFAPLKDCTKLWVYRLAQYRNECAAVIPERVLTRAPSAELRDDQKDSDSLPPYDILDPILEALIERNESIDQIVDQGYERAVVARVLSLVQRNEYKRRQAPPGVRVSSRAFGRDWRFPITSGFRLADGAAKATTKP